MIKLKKSTFNTLIRQQICTANFINNTFRRDWAGLPCDRDDAYATINHKEFFAEISVAFLSSGYTDLNEVLINNIKLCSPPFMAPFVLERLDIRYVKASNLQKQGRKKRIWDYFKQKQIGNEGHCNKFFPFTKGQLKTYDPTIALCFEEYWNIIAQYEDPQDSSYNLIPRLRLACENIYRNVLWKRLTKIR